MGPAWQVEWVPLGKWMSRMYRLFPLFPEAVLAPPAFVSELMGLSVYQHLDGVLDDILDDEPEARERVRTLLREVMTDELAHVGQRRNFLGPLGLRAAHATVESMYRAFFRDIPETKLLFNVEQMVQDGRRSTTAAFASLDASLRAPTMYTWLSSTGA